MNIKNVYILDDRAILYINGEDAKEFLQNLISNDINKVSDVNSCFSSLLTPQGKFLYEFIIVNIQKNDTRIQISIFNISNFFSLK